MRFGLGLLRRFQSVFIVIFIIVLITSLTFSQDASTGAIRGSVIDASGSRVAGASIAFVNAATGFRYAVVYCRPGGPFDSRAHFV